MLTDEQLAHNTQLGKEDDLVTLIERHYDALIGYLYRLGGGDRALAQDLVQETFIRVMRGIQQYEYPRPFKAWLYTIATNLARNHYRRPDTRRTVEEDDSLPEPASIGRAPEEIVTDEDEARLVVAQLATLPDHQREVVILRYYEELSLAEIAEVLGIPVGTVKSRLSLGLSRLRASMEEQTA